MASAPRRGWEIAGFLALALLGCELSDHGDVEASHLPAPLEHQEDEVCGMVVREQPAPRGQVVHRDGSRFFFCSLGDMLVHMGAPSPHGRAEAVFVEVLEPGDDPMQLQTGLHPWVPAREASYVVGVERPGIMGEPVLAYANRSGAELAMERYPDTRIMNLDELRDWWKARE